MHRVWVMSCLVFGFMMSGCVSPFSTHPEEAAVFSVFEQAVDRAIHRVAPSLALVKIRRDGGALNAMMRGRRPNTARPITGVVLTQEGHILIPGVVRSEGVDRIEVWLGDTEYVARIVKADDQLGMTILQIPAEKDELSPLALSDLTDLKTGSWCVLVEPSDEMKDFEKFASLSVCRGVIADRYRQFVLDGATNNKEGVPVVGINGQLVGLIQRGQAVSLKDLADDLVTFLAQATGVTSPEEEARKKSWLGAILLPINKEYAKAKKLPKSAIWVTHALKEGPAAASGVEDGDLIVALNGEPLRLSGTRAYSYFMKILRPTVGNPFSLTVLRKGKRVSCKGSFTKRPEPETLHAEDIGVTVKSITDGDYVIRDLSVRDGVLVTDVHRGSPAAISASIGEPLIIRGDVIIALAGKPTPTLSVFRDILNEVRREKPEVLLLAYWRGRTTGFAGLNLRQAKEGGTP